MSGNILILKQILPTENTFSTVGHISIAMFYLSEELWYLNWKNLFITKSHDRKIVKNKFVI